MNRFQYKSTTLLREPALASVAPPVVGAPVLLGPQQVLPPLIVGHLVGDPAALQQVEGVDLTLVEVILNADAVLAPLRHVTFVVLSLIQPQPLGARLLYPQREEATQQQMNLVGWGVGLSM